MYAFTECTRENLQTLYSKIMSINYTLLNFKYFLNVDNTKVLTLWVNLQVKQIIIDLHLNQYHSSKSYLN